MMSEDEFSEQFEDRRWPLSPKKLYAWQDRRRWYEQLWADVVDLRERYYLPLRTEWWENMLHVEALAALAVWTARYDSGEWDDPPGKLALLYDLERVAAIVRVGSGDGPFSPDRDRAAFVSFLSSIR